MAKIPQSDPFDVLNNKIEKNELRNYLGLSQIGHSCHRYLQYYHYWAHNEHVSTRILRLFNVGHDAEPKMRRDLLTIGIMTHSDQLRVEGAGGHWKGHIDDIGNFIDSAENKFLVEYKTHNDKSFKELKKKKVKLAKPTHYGQMMEYMGKLDLPKALYMAINKNDSEYYFEWVHFDEEYYKDLVRKEVEIITSDVMLPRVGNDSPAWFECKMCDAAKVCFGRSEPNKNCRTCAFVDVFDEGKWVCSNSNSSYGKLPEEVQRTGC